ncbi:MAG: hypothetical protein A2Z25_08095 [Planctomycetes bacterium RBG_16_55_9]|nr:MAG: hypothetical protein A2Z25_08095 [Planctomycetes bacterium RBG_16_55_9]
MERQVERFIESLSDLDLLEYTRTKTHLPEALEFAKIELTDRHLSADRLADLEKHLQEQERARQEQTQAKAAEPLIWEWRLAVFLCGLYFGIPLLLFFPTWRNFRNEGQDRKYSQMWHYALAGFCTQLVLVLLRIPPWSWLVGLF